MKILSFLESVNTAEKTGVFYTRKENDTEWLRINVSISPLLLWLINNFNRERRLPVTKHYVQTVFSSYNDSRSYVENPFHLVRFLPEEGVDSIENFRLEAVDETRYKTVDIITDKVGAYQNGVKRADYWVRESLHKVTTNLDRSRPLPIAPDKQFIPVI